MVEIASEQIVYNGKKLTKTESKFWRQRSMTLFYPQDAMIEVMNPISGETCKAPAIAVSIYRWTIRWIQVYEINMIPPVGSSIKEYDMARMLFLKLWPKEYMILLD